VLLCVPSVNNVVSLVARVHDVFLVARVHDVFLVRVHDVFLVARVHGVALVTRLLVLHDEHAAPNGAGPLRCDCDQPVQPVRGG
jgi:hypothetical protein